MMIDRTDAASWIRLGLVLGIVAAGCGGKKEEAPPPPPPVSPGPDLPKTPLSGNLLQNPGFENGSDPWFAMTTPAWADFDISDTVARTGEHAAILRVRGGELTPKDQIWGVSQYLNPETFPTRLSGWFRVDDWVEGAPKQYVQAVIMVWGPQPERTFQNYTVRYILGGVEEQPFYMANGRYEFLDTELPPPGEWVHFETNPAEDFEKHWGFVPSYYAKIQVFFEARFEDRTDVLAPTHGDVYFDDLYLGE